MSKHDRTPGPWEIRPNGPCFNLHSPDRVEHFCILVGMESNNPGEHEANVRLIKAVPKLLAACEKFLDTWKTAGPQGSGQFEKFDVVVREMKAAIADAESPAQENPQSEPGRG